MELEDDDAVAMLDVAQIDQVLMNLATNARDAMPDGGSLTHKDRVATLDETFRKTHGFGKPGTYVRLSVSDTGIGMDEKTMARIFDPFFTTKEVGKGTGLGPRERLRHREAARRIHHRHERAPQRDHLRHIPPPRRHDGSQRHRAASPRSKGGSETILVIEDDPDVRNMITKILSSQGYATLEAGDGDDAIRVFDEHKRTIDLVILDVVMPGKNGKEVFDEISAIDPRRQGHLHERLHGGHRHRQGRPKRDRGLPAEAALRA